LTFLTSDTETTELTADASKKFAEALHEKAPQTALADFLGSARNFYRTRGIEMFQRLCQINEPTHPNAVSGLIEQLSSIRMLPSETPSAFKLRIELLNERLPTEVAYTPALLAHAAYKGLDKTRYSSFQDNVRNGNKRIESLSSLFLDLEAFDNLAIKENTSPTPILKNGSAKKVSFDQHADKPDSSSTPSSSTDVSTMFGWKGQKDLSAAQAGWMLRKFYKGCVVCRTNTHELVTCPIVKEKFQVKRSGNRDRSSSSATATGSARTATANPDPTTSDTDDTTTTTTAENQGKSYSTHAPDIISTAAPIEISLSSSTASDPLTSVSSPSQAKHLIEESIQDDVDQRGSFQQEIFPGPMDPSISNAMHIRRSRGNVSRVALHSSISSLFTNLCMGRASKASTARIIRSGFACVDSGATHDMSNGDASDFASYRSLPQGSYVLVADNHPIECLGVGTKIWRIGGPKGNIVARREVLHVPALKAPLLSVRQHRRHQGCSFIADNGGCYLSFPKFSIPVDDSSDCLIAYETINPKGFDMSLCDFFPDAPATRESLAVVETQRYENARKQRRDPQWCPAQDPHGHAWKVETRASARRLKEQSDLAAASIEQTQHIKAEISRLEKEENEERTTQSTCSETPMTTTEKMEIIKSLTDSMEKSGEVDYLLIKEIEKKYPSSTRTESPLKSESLIQEVPSSPSGSKGYQFPTTSTPADHPDTLPCDKPPSSSPMLQRFTDQQLHRYFGFRNLKNWLDLESTGQNTIKVTKGNERPMEIGDVANIRYSRRNTTPVPRPAHYLETVHMDIGYGDCVSIGGFRYVLILIDRTTRFQWLYGLRSLTQSHIIAALEKFHADAGGLPQKIYTDFDPKLISGETEKWLLTRIPSRPCRISAAPSGRQNENGLVERAWQTTVAMARAYITDMQMPRTFWFWALRHATQVSNYIPCKVNGELTTSFELVHGVKPDYRVLFRLFSTVYFRVQRDGARDRDGVAEALSKQGIAIGRDRKSDGLLIYCPHSKKYFVSNSFKLDEGRSTATAFNLKYDGGIFIGLYDNSPISQGVEPYPEGTGVLVNNVRGTVISVPSAAIDRQLPATDDDAFYVIQLVARTADDENGAATDILRVSAIDMPSIIPPPAPWDKPLTVPSWIGHDQKVTYLHGGEYHKGFLEFTNLRTWRFSCRQRNGIEKWGVELPNLTKHFQNLLDDGTLVPGWQKTTSFIQGHVSHVSAAHLVINQAPGSLRLAFSPDKQHPDAATWLASYEEEYNGLVSHDTFDILTEQEYRALRERTGCSAIPSMNIFTIKTDSDGHPKRAKSRIVVLGNKDPVDWSKADCYAPVVPQPIVRLMTALAVRNRTTLKQADCKNAFCNSVLPDDEPTVVRPPPHCPISPPNTYWRLKKTLYGLKRSPRHWYQLLRKQLQSVGLVPTKHEDCLFVGNDIIPGRAPLYLAIYVDDLIYFSADPEVEKKFESDFASRVTVDFMGDAEFYLGTKFDWLHEPDGHVTCHLSQEGYAHMIVDAMGLQDAVTSLKMTPYRSGLPIDSLPRLALTSVTNDKKYQILKEKYRTFLGMLNWLSISTRPDLATVNSLLATATESPTQAHLEALRHVGRYIKATSDYGISFSSKPNTALEAFVQFPLDDNVASIPCPKAFADSNWGPQDASTPSETNHRLIELDETRSVCGHLIFLSHGPLIWKSHKEKRNSRSSCEAEVKATDECTKSVQWLRHVLSDLSLLDSRPTTIFNDNMAAVNWSNTTSHKAMRHVNIRENAIREAIHEFQEISVLHIGGKVNPADLFTKEHKSDEIFRSIRDSFMSRRSSGGC
jgi:Reverse transcriptase (RNA-dependent DNA polymerase)